MASLFDPLGLVVPLHIAGKILLQAAWKEEKEWDEPLSPALAEKIQSWWGEAQEVGSVQFPRWIGGRREEEVVVHVFGDASEDAYGCCIYIATDSASQLLYAKARVTPLQPPTLPRLELQAAVMAVQRLEHVLENTRLKVREIWAWSDSLTTLHWIGGEATRWKTWVRNRVLVIQEINAKYSVRWRHCPGTDNPADLASRGTRVRDLETDRWQKGPEWLLERERWPTNLAAGPVPECEEEMKVFLAAVDGAASSTDQVWYKRLSRWSRLMGVARRLLLWTRDKEQLEERATRILLRIVQRECFAEELQALQGNRPVSRSSRLYAFQPYLDEWGVMRVGGRLGNSELPAAAKHPVLLADHPITQELLRSLHVESLHQGVDAVLTKVRSLYSIIGDRRLLRSITRSCVTCRRFQAKAADECSTHLPEDRVTLQRPFAMCGIDYAGPLFVKSSESGTTKVWIALFVCGTTRAIHLEIVDSLATGDFLLAWRRFSARRGTPNRVRSDNATVFVAAAKVLRVTWVFNPPAAPWFGGFYERMVRSVKTPLRKVLGRAMLGRVELETVLTEIECTVNQRPLTCVGALSDASPPLTPAMLIGHEIWSSEDCSKIIEAGVNVTQLGRRMRYIKTVGEHLKQRWTREYLVTLNRYHAGSSRPLKQGDIVFVMDDGKRQSWRLARVVQLYSGKDGKCRVASIRTSSGTTTLRPIRKLVPMEVGEDSATTQAEDPDQTVSSSGQLTAQSALPVRTRTRVITAPRRLNL